MTVMGIVLGLLVLSLVYILLVFNRFIVLRNRIDNAWSQIDVQLKRRYDLVPNLVETVKGYASYERTTLEKVIEARSKAMGTKDVKEHGEAENFLSSTLKTIFALAERYPDLKANQNFMMLQEELSGIESKIAYARQFYNDTVMKFNILQQRFPSAFIANLFGFSEKPYFQLESTTEKEAVKVKF